MMGPSHHFLRARKNAQSSPAAEIRRVLAIDVNFLSSMVLLAHCASRCGAVGLTSLTRIGAFVRDAAHFYWTALARYRASLRPRTRQGRDHASVASPILSPLTSMRHAPFAAQAAIAGRGGCRRRRRCSARSSHRVRSGRTPPHGALPVDARRTLCQQACINVLRQTLDLQTVPHAFPQLRQERLFKLGQSALGRAYQVTLADIK